MMRGSQERSNGGQALSFSAARSSGTSVGDLPSRPGGVPGSKGSPVGRHLPGTLPRQRGILVLLGNQPLACRALERPPFHVVPEGDAGGAGIPFSSLSRPQAAGRCTVFPGPGDRQGHPPRRTHRDRRQRRPLDCDRQEEPLGASSSRPPSGLSPERGVRGEDPRGLTDCTGPGRVGLPFYKAIWF